MKKISIFGATGSIGTSTLDIIKRNNDFEVIALTAKDNYQLLAQQARLVGARYAVIANDDFYKPLQDLLSGTNTKILAGRAGMLEAASLDHELVVAAIVGVGGLASTYAAIESGADIALANKESLVCAGEIMLKAAQKHQVKIIPTDSEHNAIFQCLEQHNNRAVKDITLTASGGPFCFKQEAELKNVTVEQAIAHPSWQMGAKISVDSATMMNKALEIIEAHYLFNLPEQQIKVLIHPQSIIHSLVNYLDGSSLAQLGNPDMRIPITHALYWPRRSQQQICASLALEEIANLSFHKPNQFQHRVLELARYTLRNGSIYNIMFNVANEVAVEYFLQKKIGFLDIIKMVELMLNKTTPCLITEIDDVLAYEKECRALALAECNHISQRS